MKEWHSEEQIKAQLRELTAETRKLRHDLDALIRPSKSLAQRTFIHDRASGKQLPAELDRAQRPEPKRSEPE